MKSTDAVIVTAAITGSVNVPSQSPYLPLTAMEVADSAIQAVEAGAAIVHLHARHPDGRPAFEATIFDEIISRITDSCDPVINITTGGSSAMTMDERLAGATQCRPELASMNMGTMNFVYSGIADKITEWRHEWERPYVLNTYSQPFVNTFDRIEHALRVLGAQGTRFEYECYDIGHLYTLAHFVDRNLAQPPLLIQGVFGILGGIGADLDHVDHMARTADALFGDDYTFSAFAAGKDQLRFAARSAQLGGHVRVGLEDSLWIGKGQLARSNAEQVRAIVTEVTGMGKTIATPADARRILALRDADVTSGGPSA